MKVLYAATLAGTALHRLRALERLGHEVTAFDFMPYAEAGGRLARWLRWRTLIGPVVARLNRELLARARRERFDLIWFDKAQLVSPRTLRLLAKTGATLVHYSSDLPSRVRGDVGLRMLRRAVPDYHAVVVPSAGHEPEYRALGARRILRMPFGYDPEQHFPEQAQRDDDQRDHDVCFIGTPYENRAEFLLVLVRDYGIRIKVFGDLWDRYLDAGERALLQVEPGRYGDDYREAIWSSRLCLGFVTHAMAHGSARRWTEITACGGFLLAERTPEASDWFEADCEAVFFSDVAECAAAIHRYLPDAPARERIARAGRERVAGRLDNDSLLAGVLNRLSGDGGEQTS